MLASGCQLGYTTSEILAQNGADFNSINKEEWTPLHLAVKRGSFDAVDALMSMNHLYKKHGPKKMDQTD